MVTSPAAAAIVNVLRFISSLLVRGRAIPPDGMKLGTHPDIRVEPVLPLCNLPIVAIFGMRRPGEQAVNTATVEPAPVALAPWRRLS